MRTFTNIARSVGAGVLVCALMIGPAYAADATNGDRDVLRSISRAVAQLAADVRPAVVSVYTTRTVRVGVHRGAPAPSRPSP